MATNHEFAVLYAIFLVSALAIFPSISANNSTNVLYYGPRKASDSEKNINVVVEAMVYCQSCDLVGSQKISYGNPINGAVISVLCIDVENDVNYYKTFEANEEGHLYAELKGFMISKNQLTLPTKSCCVRLVSSPNVYCDFPTNVNYSGGLDGSALHSENKTVSGQHYKAEVYAAGPLAFRPAKCPSNRE